MQGGLTSQFSFNKVVITSQSYHVRMHLGLAYSSFMSTSMASVQWKMIDPYNVAFERGWGSDCVNHILLCLLEAESH